MRSVHVLMLFLLAAVLAGQSVQSAPAEQRAVITLFWGEGCTHCEREKEFLKELGKKHPGLRARDYEVQG